MKKINVQKSITKSKAFIWAVFHGKLRFALTIVKLSVEPILPVVGQRAATQGTCDGAAL